MVREEEGIRDNPPRRVPGQVFFVKQKTHQLRNGQRRVSLYKDFNTIATVFLKVY